MSDDEDVDVNLDDAKVEEEVSEATMEAMSNHPRYGTDGWQDYVLSLLRDEEKVMVGDSIYPKGAGLRRLAELLLGDIVFMGPTQVFPSNDTDHAGRATVVAEVHILWTRAYGRPLSFGDYDVPPRKFSEVSDVWAGNCQEPYVSHTVSTASTKALSRALKNALCLNVSTAEEMAGNNKYGKDKELPDKTLDEIVKENASVEISRPQLAFINTMCEQMKIDANKLSISMFEKNVTELDKTQGSDLIKKLQEFKNDPKQTVPEDMKI